MKRKILSLVLAAVLILGLAAPAVAYNTPDFSDVPSNHWAYEAVMKMADAGVIKGTGNGKFSPDMKLSAEMFVVLVGRVVFPDIEAEGADWSGPYVAEATAKGLLEGTNITDATIKGDIFRYDMAVILAKCVEILQISASKADSSKVTDYGDIPNRYTDAVLMAYGSGLIRGDQSGSFNGWNSMTRQEAATVMNRLLGLKGGNAQGTTTDPEKPEETEKPVDAAYTLEAQTNNEIGDTLVLGDTVTVSCHVLPSSAAAPYGHNDRSGFVCTSSNPAVVEVTGFDGWNWLVSAKSLGSAAITITDPYGVSDSKELTVISARDGLGTKTYAVSVTGARQERHSLRGEAHTEMDFIPDVPYKIYYTRDGGKTSQVVYEGVAPSGGDTERIKIELPEDAFYSKDAGLYISGEATLNGQRLVTSDLRTDGRAYANVVHNISEPNDKILSRLEFVLTPPTGEKAKYTVSGLVFYGGSSGSPVSDGFVVQLHLKDGRVVGEATTDANGEFSMDCEVDALDSGFNPYLEQYYSTAIGMQGGVQMEGNGRRKNGELLLWSMDDINANPYSTAHISSGLLVEVK